jgi:hypothetical protein
MLVPEFSVASTRAQEPSNTAMDHTFVIPIYLAAPRLGALIDSLMAQAETRSEILLTTSTPSAEIDAFAKFYALPLRINPQRIDIASDWNFALASTVTRYVTLAHQDDVFAPRYTRALSSALKAHLGAVLAFCDYSEHSPHGARVSNINLRIKRALCRRAFGDCEYIEETRRKVRLLSLGNPICCPSVMLDRSATPDFRFPDGFRTNLDWMAWLRLARRPGGFVYVRDKLVSKGVHAESATTAAIADHERQREDRALFDALWPRPVAAVLAAVYKLGYRANRV